MKNQRTIDKRKILLVIPLLILPFLALAFYAMGGGQGNSLGPKKQRGLNATLPDASFKKEKPTDKMEIYEQGGRDSVKAESNGLDQIANRLGFRRPSQADPTREIDAKLAQLNNQINQPAEPVVKKSVDRTITVPGMSSDVDRLEKLMSSMNGSSGEDQEMKQLSGMLEKVLDIQHPQRVRDAYIKEVNAAPNELFAAIPAQVAEKQTLIQGAVLKLILQDTLLINGFVLPKGHFIYGLCNLTNQRLMVDVKTIRMENNIIPVDLSLYGLDGIRGIEAPDAVVSSAISGGADDAVRSLQLLTMDQSTGVQMAGAGIDAAKGLFSKKVRRVKMKVKAGFPVLLRNNQIRK
ncbi:conjugative transposon protein TraM [Pedobacter jamesrossensis]|uniref:Conjugative transposon protein TraM n=1 Tax=Pedobacter jamesrossensis TaxID=1908238 RepID=A0ABV8NMI4_9SPHI